MSITTYKKTIPDESGQFYINLSVYNPTNLFVPFLINRTFDEVILKRAEDYEVSIVRSTIYTNDIPIIDLQQYLQVGSTTNLDLYITFTFLGIDYTRYLIFNPSSLSNLNDEQKYYIYTYDNFCALFNDTLNLLSGDINAVVPGTITDIPRLQYVPSLGRFCLFGEVSVFDNLLGSVEIWLSNVLYNLVIRLPIYFFNPLSGVKNLRLSFTEILNPYGVNNISSLGFTNPCYQMIQSFQALDSLNSAKSIIFNTDLPVVKEYDDNNRTAQNTATVQTSRLNSFILDGVNGDIFDKTTYLPTAEYRMCDLTGQSSLNRIRIECFWTDSQGFIHKLFLSPGRTSSVKLMFRKKNLKS